ncbi:MAG: hypothetical protein ABIF08_00165 [Nanoarchaeota archaeon]
MKKLFLLLPVLLVVFSSGCTTCIPFIGSCTEVTMDTADVLVFDSVAAFPTTISPEQTVRVKAYVKNLIENEEYIKTIEMYDKCEGVFDEISINCGKGEEIGGISCGGIRVYGKQTIPITWTLTSIKGIKLETACEPKIKMSYIRDTYGTSSINFINHDELKNRLEQGITEPVTSEIDVGPGPIRIFFEVEDEQPIPTDAKKTVVSLHIKNDGRGYIKDNKIKYSQIEVYGGASPESQSAIDLKIKESLNKCGFGKPKSDDDGESSNTDDWEIELMGKQETVMFCTIDIPAELENKDEAELHLSVSLKGYEYEIKEKASVVIKPHIIE